MKRPPASLVLGAAAFYGVAEIAHTANDPGDTKRDLVPVLSVYVSSAAVLQSAFDTVSGEEIPHWRIMLNRPHKIERG